MKTHRTHTRPAQWNELATLCKREGVTLSHLSRATGIERTRLHRLAWAPRLVDVLTVGELSRIVTAYPRFMIDY